MTTTAWYVRGLLVKEARLRDSEGLVLDAETPDERIYLDALARSTGISKATLSRVLNGECDVRGGGHWRPGYAFVARLQKWLGLKSDPDTRKRISGSTPIPPIHNCRTADVPYRLT